MLRAWSATLVIALALWALATSAAQARTARIDGPPGVFLAEPHLAVNPADPRNVTVVAKDVTNDGFAGVSAFVSRDAARTFKGGLVVGGRYLGAKADASDPVVAFDRAGIAHFGQLVWRYPGRGFESLMGVQRSLDGGATWQQPVAVVRTRNRTGPMTFGEVPAPSVWHDKEWLAVDRSGGALDGHLYMAWVRVRVTRRAELHRIAVSSSPDGGATWTAPRLISPARSFPLGPQVAVTPDGRVHVAWAAYRRDPADRRGTVYAASSSDGGASFSAPRRVARFLNPAVPSLISLAASEGGRLLLCWPAGVWSPRGARASIHEARSSRIVCSRRSRGGRRWSRPAAVMRGARSRTQDLAAVAAEEDDRFWVSFYDFTAHRLQVRLHRSADGGRRFDSGRVLARRRGGLTNFVGDYAGLAAAGGRVHAAYVLPRSSAGPPRNSIYVRSAAAR